MSDVTWFAVCQDNDNFCVSIGTVVASAEDLADHGLHIGDERAFPDGVYPMWDPESGQLVVPPEVES